MNMDPQPCREEHFLPQWSQLSNIKAVPEVLAHSAAGVGGKVLQRRSIRGCKRGTPISHNIYKEKHLLKPCFTEKKSEFCKDVGCDR